MLVLDVQLLFRIRSSQSEAQICFIELSATLAAPARKKYNNNNNYKAKTVWNKIVYVQHQRRYCTDEH